jgi:hypothetical protein
VLHIDQQALTDASGVMLRRRLHLPVRLGGLGIPSIQAAVNAAYIGSWALVCKQVQDVLPELTPQQCIGLEGSVAAMASLPAMNNVTAASILAQPRAKLQHALAADQASRDAAAVHDSLVGDAQLWFESSGTPQAGAWLTANPRYARMSDVELQVSVYLRLGLPVAEPGVCKCGKQYDALGHHAFTCPIMQKQRTFRHSAVLSTVVETVRPLRSLGIRVQKEVNMDSLCERHNGVVLQDGLRADAVVYEDATQGSQVLDVTITHRTADALAPGGAAAVKEAAKVAKYEGAYIFGIGDKVWPLAFETPGAMGRLAIDFVRWLAQKQVDLGGPVAYSVWLRRFVERVAVALQRANAGIVRGFCGYKKPAGLAAVPAATI